MTCTRSRTLAIPRKNKKPRPSTKGRGLNSTCDHLNSPTSHLADLSKYEPVQTVYSGFCNKNLTCHGLLSLTFSACSSEAMFESLLLPFFTNQGSLWKSSLSTSSLHRFYYAIIRCSYYSHFHSICQVLFYRKNSSLRMMRTMHEMPSRQSVMNPIQLNGLIEEQNKIACA